MNHPRSIPCLSIALALFVAACGGSQTEVEHPVEEVVAPEAPPEAWLPPDAELVARIDLAQVRQSPFFDTLAGYAVQAEQALAERGVSIPLGAGRLLGAIDQVWLGTSLTNEVGVVVVRHRIAPDELDAALRTVEDDAHRPIFTRFDAVADRQAWQGTELEAADLGDGYLAIATTGLLAGTVARRGAATGRGPLDQPRLAALAERAGYDQAEVGVVGTFNEVLKQRMRDRGRGGEEVDAFGARLSIQSGIDGLAVADTASPSVATDLAVRAMSEINAARRQPMVAMLGLAPALAGLEVRAESKSVIGELHIGQDDTATLLSRLSGFLTIAIQSLVSEIGPSAPPADAVE